MHVPYIQIFKPRVDPVFTKKEVSKLHICAVALHNVFHEFVLMFKVIASENFFQYQVKETAKIYLLLPHIQVLPQQKKLCYQKIKLLKVMGNKLLNVKIHTDQVRRYNFVVLYCILVKLLFNVMMPHHKIYSSKQVMESNGCVDGVTSRSTYFQQCWDLLYLLFFATHLTR